MCRCNANRAALERERLALFQSPQRRGKRCNLQEMKSFGFPYQPLFQSPQRRGKRCNIEDEYFDRLERFEGFNPLRGGASAATSADDNREGSLRVDVSIPSEAGQALQHEDWIEADADDVSTELGFNPLRGGASAATWAVADESEIDDAVFQSPQRRGKRCNLGRS